MPGSLNGTHHPRQAAHLNALAERRRARTRKRIVERYATLLLLGQQPKSLARLAEEAGVSTATYYRHKDEDDWSGEILKADALAIAASWTPQGGAEEATLEMPLWNVLMISNSRNLREPEIRKLLEDAEDAFAAKPEELIRSEGRNYVETPFFGYLLILLRLLENESAADTVEDRQERIDYLRTRWSWMHSVFSANNSNVFDFINSDEQLSSFFLHFVAGWAYLEGRANTRLQFGPWLKERNLEPGLDSDLTRFGLIRGILAGADETARGGDGELAAVEAVLANLKLPPPRVPEAHWRTLLAKVWLEISIYPRMRKMDLTNTLSDRIMRTVDLDKLPSDLSYSDDVRFVVAIAQLKSKSHRSSGLDSIQTLLLPYIEPSGDSDVPANDPAWNGVPPLALGVLLDARLTGTDGERTRAQLWLENLQLLAVSKIWKQLDPKRRTHLAAILEKHTNSDRLRNDRLRLISSTHSTRSPIAERPDRSVGRILADANAIDACLESGAVITFGDVERLKQARSLIDSALERVNGGTLLGRDQADLDPDQVRIAVVKGTTQSKEPRYAP